MDRKKNITEKGKVQEHKDKISKNTSFNSFVSDRQTYINFLEQKIDTLKKDEQDISDTSKFVDKSEFNKSDFNEQVKLDEILHRLVEMENKMQRVTHKMEKEQLFSEKLSS